MFSTNTTAGTFHFCTGCPANNNCCVRVRELGQVDAPFILDQEARNIEAKTGIAVEEFTEVFANPGRLQTLALKTENNSCFFYKDRRCTIYAHRPFDCKIFPFDIIEKDDGIFFWIIFLELCPVKFNFDSYFNAAKQLFIESGMTPAELHHFAHHRAESMLRHNYKVLEEIKFRDSQ